MKIDVCPGDDLRTLCPSERVGRSKLIQTNLTEPIGVRAGGRGGLQPPQILGNSDVLGSKRKFGQSLFLKTFPCLLNYFEDLNINMKSA